MSTIRPFHLAVPVDDLAAARRFYGEILGCREGRSADTWIDFDLYGHQFVAHLKQTTADAADRDKGNGADSEITNSVQGHDVPVPHFGVVLSLADWRELRARLEAHDVPFPVPPHVRWPGQPGEQATLFIRDPAGNALEFKGMDDLSQLFAT